MTDFQLLALLNDGPMTIKEIYRNLYHGHLTSKRPYEAMGGCRSRLKALASRHKIRPCRIKRNGSDDTWEDGYYRVKPPKGN